MIVCLTYIPSPYQVEYFDALSAATEGDFRAVYLTRAAPGRSWAPAPIRHAHCFLDEGRLQTAMEWTRSGCFMVFAAYRQPYARRLLAARAAEGLPWAFWGERPGVVLQGWPGRLVRAILQRHLRASGAPIWGIGAWAVEGYRTELGNGRLFFNVPYFSNLDPYLAISRQRPARAGRRFLFSGSLIPRKGVDLLARAFARLVASRVDATLTFAGAGPLEASLRETTRACAERVRFLGFRQWADLPAVYAEADILCAPSLYDGWGLIVPEGLAAGMPVISTDRTGSARELVKPENGWIVPAGDEEALFAALSAAASAEPARLAEMVERARLAARRQNLNAGVARFLAAVAASREAWAKGRETAAAL